MQFLTTHGQIQLFEHHLVIPANRAINVDALTIREQPLAVYAEFLKHWETAMGQVGHHPGAGFAYMWLHDPVFSGELTAALAVMGVEHPDRLRPAQLSELVLSASFPDEPDSGDLRGLLFRLHQELPKFPGLNQERQTTPDSPRLTAIEAAQYFLANTFNTDLAQTLTLRQVNRFAEVWAWTNQTPEQREQAKKDEQFKAWAKTIKPGWKPTKAEQTSISRKI